MNMHAVAVAAAGITFSGACRDFRDENIRLLIPSDAVADFRNNCSKASDSSAVRSRVLYRHLWGGDFPSKLRKSLTPKKFWSGL